MRAALLAYKEVHGDLEVPQAFVVLSEAAWPEEAWGLKLGLRVKQIRKGSYVKGHPERRAELGKMGFRWSAEKDPNAPKKVKAARKVDAENL